MDAPFASGIAQPAPATPMPMMAMNSTSKMQVTTGADDDAGVHGLLGVAFGSDELFEG